MPEKTDDESAYLSALRKWMRETIGIEDEGNIFPKNDWLLIIKLHAMIEAALNRSLSIQFGLPELDRVIGKLDTSNGSIGKVAFAKALKILRNQSIAFIQKLSELRNICVHDIRNFKFDLTTHLSKLDNDDRNALLNAIAKEIRPEITLGDERVTAKELADRNPRFGLAIATMNVMAQLHFHQSQCETRNLETKIVQRKAELFDEQNQSTPTEEPNSPQIPDPRKSPQLPGNPQTDRPEPESL